MTELIRTADENKRERARAAAVAAPASTSTAGSEAAAADNDVDGATATQPTQSEPGAPTAAARDAAQVAVQASADGTPQR